MATKAPSALSRLNTPAKVGVGAALVALTAVVYWVVFYGDLATSITAAERKEQQLKVELAEARKAEHAYQKDLEELADRQQRQRELNKVLPTDTEYPAFLSAIQTVANVAGVTLVAWNPDEEVPEEFFSRIPMKIDLTGQFHQLARFFYNVGQLDRIINIENISLGKPTISDKVIILEASAMATAFRSVESDAAGPTAQVKKQ